MPAPNKNPELQTYRVYVEQVNQSMLIVQANDANEAREKGYAKWRRDYAHSSVCSVELVPARKVPA